MNGIQGVVLAAGQGTRLRPTSRVVNKHLLDVYDQPMIWYPLMTLRNSGVTDIVVVTEESAIPDFRTILEPCTGVNIRLVSQRGRPGVAGALASVEAEVTGSPIVVLLGDTLFQLPLREATDAFLSDGYPAQILLGPVQPDRASSYGIATLRGDRVVDVTEKPAIPSSALAVLGCYWYDDSVFDRIRAIRPSPRGELEISDVNASYAREGKLSHRHLSGWTADAGTPAGKLRAALLVAIEKGVRLEL
jgi:glucose-1-phosphate thymidylyltransferase